MGEPAVGGGRKTDEGGARRGLIAALAWALAAGAAGAGPQGVRINEAMSSNGGWVRDSDGDSSDWIELFNGGTEEALLEGWGLSDKAGDPFRWRFPGVALEAGGHLLVWASGKNRVDPQGELHANFSIAAEGEEIRLTMPGGAEADAMPATALPRDVALGRKEGAGDGWHYFDRPTPGAANVTTGYLGILAPPTFTLEPGFYPEGGELGVVHSDPEATIRYTQDGRFPDEDSPEWKEALRLEAKETGGEGIAGIATSPPEADAMGIGWLPPLEANPAGMAVRAAAFKEGHLTARAASGTWFAGPAFAGERGLDVVALIVDPADFFDGRRGIYVPGDIYEENGFGEHQFGSPNANYYQRGSEWERPGHFELFTGEGRRETFGDVGIRIHGNASRILPQKSLRLYDSGGGGLSHPFFPEREAEAYESLILRNSGQDWFAHGPTMLRDGCLQRLVGGMDFERQAHRPTAAYVNGEYWGIHNAMEHVDLPYLAGQFGVEEEAIDLLETRETNETAAAETYEEMLQYMRGHDLSEEAHYRHVQTRMDVESYADYVVAETFLANGDWPGNNVDLWRKRTEWNPLAPKGQDGRWRWILTDLDFAALPGTVDRDMIEWLREPTPRWPRPAWSIELVNHLWKNEEFAAMFCRRYADHLNTTFRAGRAEELLEGMAEEIEGEIVAHFRRWGRDVRLETWRGYVGDFRRFLEERPAHARAHLRKHFGLGEMHALKIVNRRPERGVVHVNGMPLDGERTAGVDGRPEEWEGTYFGGMPIELTAVAEPGYRFSRWGGVDSDAPRIEVELAGAWEVEAEFEPAEEGELLHYWSCNAGGLEPVHSQGGGRLSVAPGPGTQVALATGQGFANANGRMGEPVGSHLRINQPLGAALEWALPTTGHENVVVRYEARRSGEGPGMHYVGYTADGREYRHVAAGRLENGDPQVFELDFTGNPDASDNPLFGIRVEFEKGAGGEGGNARFDNISVEGIRARRGAQAERIGEAQGRVGAWDEGAQSLGGGWRRLGWFGDYAVMEPEGWIWHNQHGFFCVADTSTPGDAWLFANDMGWLYTGNALYPFMYRASDGAWIWHNGATDPRWFMNFTSGQWESRP